MSILWIGWELFINLLEEGMFCYLLTKALGYKKDKVVRLYLGFFLLIIFTTILNVAVQHTNIVIFLLLVADIIFSTVCFESNYSSRFFWGCSASVIGILSNTVVFSMVSFFTNYDLNTLTVPSTIRIQMTLIYLVVCSVFYFTIIELSCKKAILLPRVLQIVLFILLSLGIVASDMLIELSLSIPGNQITTKLGFIGVVYLSVLLGCVFLFEVLGDYFHKNSALRLQLREASLLENHLENIQASMKTLRQWKHDYHHHTQAMQMLLENQQYSELNTYLAQFNSDFTNLTSMVSTGNLTLDAILSSKILIAKSHGIAVEQAIFLPEKLSIPQTDLCIVLGNLLDNAIEACNKPNQQQPPYINITIKIHKGMLYFKVVNSSNGIYLFDNKKLISTKKQPEHGYGFHNINKIVENYGGFFNYEPENSSFAATIMIPFQREEEEK
ncbi:sensor histidine kinase [Anaerotignum propionicum]|uniref:GHKL domain-containing protein n=1 Tax=Anaerotignum propionicum DSM 1682 TaxID=991789 RepID=A0A120MK96_ANAPI|nr:GHKL domain-containing protein [Anaerotignum propionicum]AMJ41583.1 sensory histidine kinase DcuS [Anaerotignum propionicum DSM 1682]SHE86582.1 GHKL domain-containing protein [[Clostridium] propionicum DSM 1682] [Anaerotignum propionicum DSM 1682]